MSIRPTFIAIVLALAAVLSPVSVLAQGAAVNGRVLDPQGAAVANAEVMLSGNAQPARTVRSAGDGTFTVAGVPAGTYQLLVQAPGFGLSSQDVVVGAAASALTITLQVGGLTEDVTVQGALTGTAATGKTNVPIRELPMTINSIPTQVIREQGANDLVSVLQNVSGVNAFTNYGVYEYYAFRGFFGQDVQLLDGVRNEGNRINTQLANIERVDVLKGPSSALYGGSALGATVNLIRKKPSAFPSYDASVAAGSWSLGRGAFGATGRLAGESLLYRLDAGAETKEGYRHNDTRRVNLTPSLAWRIAGQNQVNVYYTFSRDRFAGDAGIPLLNTDFGTPTADSVFPAIPRDRNFRTPEDQATSYDNNLQVAFARQLSNAVGFRNTLSYRHFNDDYFLMEYLFVEPPSSVYRERLQFTHHRRPLTNLAEVTARLTRGPEQNLVLGWEAQRYNNRTKTIPGGGVASAEPIDLFNPVETQPADDGFPIARVVHFTNVTNALYFQDHITLTPQVKALVGGRYDIYRRSTHTNPVSNGVETEGPLVRREANAFTTRLGVVYQPVPQLDLYGSFANSFRPPTQAQPDGTSLAPERGEQFEFGQRVHLLGDRVQLNTAVYRIVRTDVPLSRPGGLFVQAGEMRSKGFEADVSTSPAANWRITGGYGFTAVEYSDFVLSATSDLTGNTPPFAPRHTFSLWTTYDWTNGFGLSVGVRGYGSQWAENFNVLKLDGYGIVNLAARYTRGPLEFAVNVNNLTDTDYFSSVLYDSQMYPGDPVNVLGTLRVRFR